MAWEITQPIVVPIDFSGLSVDAVNRAAQIAANQNQIHVVHVVPKLDQIAPGSPEGGLPTDEDRRTTVIKHFREFLNKHGCHEAHCVVLDGEPET